MGKFGVFPCFEKDVFHVRITNLCLQIFNNVLRNRCFVLAITCTRAHLITYQAHAHQLDFLTKLKNPLQTKTSQKNLRPRHWKVCQGKSYSAWSSFFGHYLENYLKKEIKMDHTKLDQKYLDLFNLQELSVRGLGFVAALSVCSGIDSSCAYSGEAIQLESKK